MQLLRQFRITALIITYTLFPPKVIYSGLPITATHGALPFPQGCRPAAPKELKFYLADLSLALDENGELALVFPGCLSLAAPFLLFRLKREGFSACRAFMASGGLILYASR